jgi:hypothetical protein
MFYFFWRMLLGYTLWFVWHWVKHKWISEFIGKSFWTFRHAIVTGYLPGNSTGSWCEELAVYRCDCCSVAGRQHTKPRFPKTVTSSLVISCTIWTFPVLIVMCYKTHFRHDKNNCSSFSQNPKVSHILKLCMFRK